MIKRDILHSLMDARELTEREMRIAEKTEAEGAVRAAAEATRALIKQAAQDTQKIAARLRA